MEWTMVVEEPRFGEDGCADGAAAPGGEVGQFDADQKRV